MEVRINGESATLPGTLTLLELLEQRDFNPRTVVVEHNLAVVAKEDFAGTRIMNGDCLEILHFVGGG